MSRLKKPIPGNLGNALMRGKGKKKAAPQQLPFVQLQVMPNGIVRFYGPISDKDLCYRIMCGGIEALNSHFGVGIKRMPTPSDIQQLTSGTANANAGLVQSKIVPGATLPSENADASASLQSSAPESRDSAVAGGVEPETTTSSVGTESCSSG